MFFLIKNDVSFVRRNKGGKEKCTSVGFIGLLGVRVVVGFSGGLSYKPGGVRLRLGGCRRTGAEGGLEAVALGFNAVIF